LLNLELRGPVLPFGQRDELKDLAMSKIEIRQIFYDQITRSQIQAPFIPLDNTLGDKSWFEFWAIYNFFSKNEDIQENCLYGFLSPKFSSKTGLSAISAIEEIESVIDKNERDVVLFSYAWDQLCFFSNPWEQGEVFHPGIKKYTQNFINTTSLNIDIDQLFTSRQNSVFSNFFVAKKSFWERWMDLANSFLIYADDTYSELFQQLTPYRSGHEPIKAFIQERFPALILATNSFSVGQIDVRTGFSAPFFVPTNENKNRLFACDRIKDKIIAQDPDPTLIDEFYAARSQVYLNLPTE